MNIVLTPPDLATWHRKSFSGQKKKQNHPNLQIHQKTFVIWLKEHHNLSRLIESSELVTHVSVPEVRGVRLEKLLTARLWPRCLRLQAVRHLESMLCLIRYQSDSEMPNLWNKWPAKRKKDITSLISTISKSSRQMIPSYHRNHMEQQTCNQSTVKWNRQYKIVKWVVLLRPYVIEQKLIFCLFSEKAEQVKQKSPGSAPASTYLSQAKSACNYTHTARSKQEFIEFTVTLQMCPAGGRSYS